MIQRIAFRNMYADDTLKKLVQKKIRDISKYKSDLTRMDMIIQKNKHFLKPGDKFNCHLSVVDDSGFSADVNDKGDSPGKAITLAFSRLRKAVKRYHRKMYNHRRIMFKKPINKSMPGSLAYDKETDMSFKAKSD